MEDLEIEEGIYKAIKEENDPKQCSINLNKRIGAINDKFFKGNQDIFKDWKFYKEEDNAVELCICGHIIYNKFIIKKGDVKCQIGNTCIEKFFPLIYQEIKFLKRKTEYCQKCDKNYKKIYKHGFCNKCGVDMKDICSLITCQECFDKCDCGKSKKTEFRQCYNCKTNNVKTNKKCRLCRRRKPYKFFSTCKSCYMNDWIDR